MNNLNIRRMNKGGILKGAGKTDPRKPAPATKFEDEDNYDEDFENDSPGPKAKGRAGEEQKSATASAAGQTQFASAADVPATSWTNKHIIYKFMKKGFTSLGAEELACTMVNPDFTIDFKKATNEDWAGKY